MKPRNSRPLRADDRCLSDFIDLRQRTLEPVVWKDFRREWFRSQVTEGIAVAREAAGATRCEVALVIVSAVDGVPPFFLAPIDKTIFRELARRGISRSRAVAVVTGMFRSGRQAEVVR
jgi:hypothetical protein